MTCYTDTIIDVESIVAEVEGDASRETIKYINIPLRDADGYAKGFDDDTIIDTIQMHDDEEQLEENVKNEIYHWSYGPYFITDLKAIFTKKVLIDQKEINKARDAISFTKKLIKQGRLDADDVNPACFEMIEQIDNLYIYSICKRNNKKQRMRFYIYPNKVKSLEELGYKVYSEKSHFMRYDVKKDAYYHPTVHYAEIDVDAFSAMCRTKMPIRKGYRLDETTGEEVMIKKGRPSKEIKLIDADGNEMIFSSKEVLASMLGCSLSTVKRALKDKAVGDIVTLRKKQNFIMN